MKSSERRRLTQGHEGHAWWKEPGHSYRSSSSYRKLPPPACPGTACKALVTSSDALVPSSFLLQKKELAL